MKIALCISGQPRYVRHCFPEIHNKFIKNHDTDVFFHCWYEPAKVGQKFEFLVNDRRTGHLEPDIDKVILDLYKPKLNIIEPQINFNIDFLNGKHTGMIRPFSIPSMWYSIKKANDLKTEYEALHNFKYDLVIRCRFDLVFDTYNIDIEKLDPTQLHVAGELNPTLNDQCAISSSENIDWYSKMYDKLEYYSKIMNNMVNEHTLTHHICKESKIVVNYHDDFRCNICKL